MASALPHLGQIGRAPLQQHVAAGAEEGQQIDVLGAAERVPPRPGVRLAFVEGDLGIAVKDARRTVGRVAVRLLPVEVDAQVVVPPAGRLEVQSRSKSQHGACRRLLLHGRELEVVIDGRVGVWDRDRVE